MAGRYSLYVRPASSSRPSRWTGYRPFHLWRPGGATGRLSVSRQQMAPRGLSGLSLRTSVRHRRYDHRAHRRAYQLPLRRGAAWCADGGSQRHSICRSQPGQNQPRGYRITTQDAITLRVVRQFKHQCFRWAVSRRKATRREDVANYPPNRPPTNVLLVLKMKFLAKIFAL
jgi:hypothetical protein